MALSSETGTGSNGAAALGVTRTASPKEAAKRVMQAILRDMIVISGGDRTLDRCWNTPNANQPNLC